MRKRTGPLSHHILARQECLRDREGCGPSNVFFFFFFWNSVECRKDRACVFAVYKVGLRTHSLVGKIQMKKEKGVVGNNFST